MRSLSNYPGQNILLKARPTTLTLDESARSLSNPAPQKRLVRSPGPSATLGRTSGLPSSTRGRSRMVQRPCPDLREGCAAMRIPTATEGRGAAMPPPTRPQKHVRLHGTTESLPFTLRRAAHDLETKRCLCGTWIKQRSGLEKKTRNRGKSPGAQVSARCRIRSGKGGIEGASGTLRRLPR